MQEKNLCSKGIQKGRLQNSRFFLKISKEIGKAWRKSLTREAREPHTPVGRVRREKKKPTVRFPYNEFVPTRGFKNVVELSKICSQLRFLCEFE